MPHVKRRPPAGKTQKKIETKKRRKRLFPKFYLDSKLKRTQPQNFGKKSAQVCRGLGSFSTLFNASTNRHTLFSIKNTKFQVFSGRFAFFAFFLRFAFAGDISGKKCRKC
jgi:hypothetical protein